MNIATMQNPMKRTSQQPQQQQQEDGNGNLSNDTVDTTITPETSDNVVHISICSFVCSLTLCGSRAFDDIAR